MLKSNAEKEVLYIFLWLIGIIFVYTLVHTFLLEPSTSHKVATSNKPATYPRHTTATKNHIAPDKDKIVSTANTKNALVEPQAIAAISVIKISKKKVLDKNDNGKVSKMVHKAIQTTSTQKTIIKVKTPNKVKILKMIKKVKSKHIDIASYTAKTSEVPNVPSLPSVPSIPSIPSVPSVPAPLSVEKILPIQVLKMKTIKNEQIKRLDAEINREKHIKLIDTARKHVIEKAEMSRHLVY